MNVACTVGVAKMDECGVDHDLLLALFQKVLQTKVGWDTTFLILTHLKVAEMSVASPDAVSGAILVKHKHHARGKPALRHKIRTININDFALTREE